MQQKSKKTNGLAYAVLSVLLIIIVIFSYLKFIPSINYDNASFASSVSKNEYERSKWSTSVTPPHAYNERKNINQMWADIVNRNRNEIPHKRLPGAIGIGVKKCGTSAGVRFVGQHPLVVLPPRVETNFFNKYYHRGLRYYRWLMANSYDDQLVIEKTPSYFFNEDVPARIRSSLPNVKLMLIICNPVDRAFSDFVHTFYAYKANVPTNAEIADKFHNLAKTFASRFLGENDVEKIAKQAHTSCKQKPTNCIFSKGIYHEHLLNWYEYFNTSQILIQNGDDWIKKTGELYEELQTFLGLPPLIAEENFIKSPENGFFCLDRFWDNAYHDKLKKVGETTINYNGRNLFCLGSKKGNTRNGARAMHEETRKLLEDFYKLHNEKLYGVVNKDFGW